MSKNYGVFSGTGFFSNFFKKSSKPEARIPPRCDEKKNDNITFTRQVEPFLNLAPNNESVPPMRKRALDIISEETGLDMRDKNLCSQNNNYLQNIHKVVASIKRNENRFRGDEELEKFILNDPDIEFFLQY